MGRVELLEGLQQTVEDIQVQQAELDEVSWWVGEPNVWCSGSFDPLSNCEETTSW